MVTYVKRRYKNICIRIILLRTYFFNLHVHRLSNYLPKIIRVTSFEVYFKCSILTQLSNRVQFEQHDFVYICAKVL